MKFLILACFIAATSAISKDAIGFMGTDTRKWTPLVCRDGHFSPNDDRTKEVGACGKTYGVEPGMKNPNCIWYCQAAALGLLGSEGLPKVEIYDKWVKESFPAQHKKAATAHFRDCYAKFGKYMGTNDVNCEYAKKFGDCTWQVVPSVLTCPKQ